MLILFRTEVGELEVLGGTRERETAQDYTRPWDRVFSPTRKGRAGRLCGKSESDLQDTMPHACSFTIWEAEIA